MRKLHDLVMTIGYEVRESVVSYFAPIRVVAQELARSVRASTQNDSEGHGKAEARHGHSRSPARNAS